MRYHGLLAPNARHRRPVVAAPAPTCEGGDEAGGANLGRVAMTWMQRLRRVFGIDIGHCPRCGASLRVVAVITSPRASSTSSSSTSTPDTPAPPAGARDGPRGDRAQPERGRSRRKDMRIDTMTKVAIYARYSSDNQGEASIED